MKKLVSNPKHEIKKLIEYCDFDWEENCLIFQKTKHQLKLQASVKHVTQYIQLL